MEAPCGKCERKGCGSYHDICEEYQKFRRVADEIHDRRMTEMAFSDDIGSRVKSMKTNRNSNGVGRSYKK